MPEEQGVKLLTVTQEDREAAADCRVAYAGESSASARTYRQGDRDTSVLVQAFARHRIAAQSADDTLIEELVEAEVEQLISELTRIMTCKWGAQFGFEQTAVWAPVARHAVQYIVPLVTARRIAADDMLIADSKS